MTLGGLSQTYDGEPKNVTLETEPEGLTVVVTYDGELEAPSATGSYAVVATVDDAIWAGSAEGMLVVLEPEPEKSEYEFWLKGLGLDVADYPESRVEDGDEDGMSNWAEFVAGTNPSEKTNFFAISADSMAGGVLRLEAHPVLPDRFYSMVYWTNLLAPPQTNVLGRGFGSLIIETNVPGTWFGTIRVRLLEP